jgi:hypothetical protein
VVATHTAIADVGETLVELLRTHMDDLLLNREDVALVSPANAGSASGSRLTLYLYRVAPNSHLRNAERQEQTPDRERPPPLALDLYYLLTAHQSTGGTNDTAETTEQHRVLGRAMQVIQDNALLRGSDLVGSLAGGPDLAVTMADQSLEETVSVWNTFGEEPYEPSVAYLVTPVLIDSAREETTQRVVERTEQYRIREEQGDE